jgi:hypothetical protein
MGKRPKENSANELAVGPCQSRASLPRNIHKKWDKREMPTADERPLPKREAWTRAHSESFRETDLEELAERFFAAKRRHPQDTTVPRSAEYP